MRRAVPRVVFGLAVAAVVLGPTAKAFAQNSDADNNQTKRPRVTIFPRHVGPDAKRHCQSWLAQEYRVSGPVIVPQMRCWWD